MNSKMMALALVTMAGTALAQPAVFTDLGNRTTTQAFTQNVTTLGGADVQWFRIELPAVSAAGGGWVDIWTTPTSNPVAATDLTDTEIGMYDNFGVGAGTGVLWNNDDGGPGLFSQLSYGSTVSRGATTYPGQTNGAARNGNAGPLAGGVYWIAVVRYNATFAQNFVVTSTATSPQTTTVLNFDIASSTDPYPPTGTGAATAATVGTGDTSVLTVTVTPGGNPVSTNITVTGDLSQIGGSATQQFFDDGTNGDVTVGDNVFTYTATVTAEPAAYQLPFNIADGETRSGSGNINLTVSAPTNMALNGGVAPSAVTSTSVLITATVTPGGFPASSGVTVTADLTSMGGSATTAMFDDGTHGDVLAGNNVYSLEVPLPADGTYSIVLNAADAQSRTATKTVALLYKDAGDIAGTDTDLSTIDVITSSMPSSVGNVAWMKFNLTGDVSNDGDDATIGMFLDIDTETTGADAAVIGTLSDTELGLYRPDGSFVVTDDDDGSYFHSMLSFGDVAPNRTAQGVAPNAGVVGNGRDGALTAGVYYMAIANYNAVFNPGFGATTPNTAAEAGDFVVNFRTNIPGGGTGPCSAADVGVAGGEPGQDNLLDNNDFIAFINFFFEQNPIADQGQAGGEYGSDGLYDNNDFIAFINHFFEDAANCNG